MIQKQAESVKDLAKRTVEALGGVTERKCKDCNGLGTIYSFGNDIGTCNKCNGTGKVG